MQTDSRWALYPYTSTGNQSQTIGSSGCGILTAIMVLYSFNISDITPQQLADKAVKLEFRTPNDGTSWDFFPWLAREYGLKFKQTWDFNVFLEEFKKEGTLVICSMGRKSPSGKGFFTSSGHLILTWGADSKGLYSNDSISSARTNIPVNPNIWKNECIQYFIFSEKENEMFKDLIVNGDKHWAADIIEQAAKESIVKGVEQADGSFLFKPNDPITRAGAVVLIIRALGKT